MRVELDVYSGRPNPAWNLTAEQGEEFLKLLRSLPKTSGGAVRQGLGYRGVIVTADGGKVTGYNSIIVSDGIVLGNTDTGEEIFLDANRALERWLFNTGKGFIEKDTYTMIENELRTN